MRGTGLDDDGLARAGDDRLPARLEPNLALEDLEDLGLVGVDVRGCDEAVRLDAHLDEDVLASGLGGRADDVNVSPVTGLWRTSPLRIMCGSLCVVA